MVHNNKIDKALKIISNKLNRFDIEEIELFFRAFFTPSELQDLADRIAIVEHLVQGTPQRAIINLAKVSPAKITAGSREYKYGYGKEIFEKFASKDKE